MTKKQLRNKRLLKIALRISLIIVAAMGIFVGIILLWIATFQIPTLDSFTDRKVTQSTKIYDRTGEIILYDVYENIKRTVVRYEQISKHTKNATIAIEDENFYNHAGIDPRAILRAVFVNLRDGEYSQGGSTITQQVIKNSVLTNEKTITRKLKEWVLALRLDRLLEKDEILNLYLNEIPYGGSIYGVQEASLAFFGKNAIDLSIAEAAYIAALPQAPTYYSPYGNNTDRLEARKNTVLLKMFENKFITQQEYEQAKNEEVVFISVEDRGIKAPHFVLFVKEQLAKKYGEEALEQNGLRVITTLDYELQKKSEEIVKKYALENDEKFNASNAATVAIDPKTGEVLVMVGSRDYFDEEIDGNFNIATSGRRQPGSAFKPFAYAQAFIKGYTPETILFDVATQFSTNCSPTNFTSADGCYSPQNYDNIFRGPITMRNALAQSVNIPAVKTLYLANTNDTIDLARSMGVSTLTSSAQYGLTLALGGGEVSLIDMVSAYGVFANEGARHPYKTILEVTDREGSVLEKRENEPADQALPRNAALQISDVLSDNIARTPAFGSNSQLFFPGRDVAVKTGTTNDYRDAWIIGYTPQVVVGTWAGNNDNTSMEKRVAGFIVAPMWNELVNAALEKMPNEPFPKPQPEDSNLKPILRGIWQGGSSYLINSETGEPAMDDTPVELIREVTRGGVHSILYWVNKDNPRGPQPSNPQQDGQFILWERPVQLWSEQQGFRGSSADSGQTEGTVQLQITHPTAIREYRTNESIDVLLHYPSEYGIESITYVINGNTVHKDTTSPFNYRFRPEDISVIQKENSLDIQLHTENYGVVSTSATFRVDI